MCDSVGDDDIMMNDSVNVFVDDSGDGHSQRRRRRAEAVNRLYTINYFNFGSQKYSIE